MPSNGKRKPLPPKEEDNPPERFLRLPEVLKLVGLRTTSVYARMAEGTFPKPVRIGSRNVAWLASEIAAYQAERIAERDRAA